MPSIKTDSCCSKSKISHERIYSTEANSWSSSLCVTICIVQDTINFHILLWVQLKFGPCMLPDVDTDLQQLSIPATVSYLKPLTSLDYYVHSALAANIHSWSLPTVVSQGVCGKAWEFLWWVRLLLEDQESTSSTKDKGHVLCVMQHCRSQKYLKLKTQQGKYRWSFPVTIMLTSNSWPPVLKPLRLWSRTGINPEMTIQIVVSSSNLSLSDTAP